MTLIELLLAVSVVSMIVGALGAVAAGIQKAYEYSEGFGTATQHARVALDRIAKTVGEATANEQFPGFIVVTDNEGAWTFPETLVVWRPQTAAADPKGLPRFNELVIYCPDWYTPSKLVEIRVPSDTRTVPAVSNTAQWAVEIEAIRKNKSVEAVTLTTLLRTATVSGSGASRWRGVVRFAQRLRPNDTQWAQFKAGTLAWNDLYWVQGLFGSQVGLRQAWLRTELQLLPGATWVSNDPASQRAIPFFGSAAVYYEMRP
jgi:type II secretory pathway pseudopilin PulG